MHASITLPRRALLASLVLPALQGCTAPLPPLASTGLDAEAQALLAASAAAHGAVAFASVRDISVSYAGQWRAVVDTLQPDLVDAGFRGRSEERLLPHDQVSAQAYTGPKGRKQVVRDQSGVRVWFNGQESHDVNARDASALVADGYSLFLLGPILLAGPWSSGRALPVQSAAPERITVGGERHDCDVLRLSASPGLGLSERDELALFIDRGERLMRRVRFTLNGLESTRGAIAEVDCWGHVAMHGVRWPTSFHERLLRPLPIPVHDWRMTGLDLNRGLTAAAIAAAEFTGPASAPAQALA